jgi:ribosome biogenesis GTPase
VTDSGAGAAAAMTLAALGWQAFFAAQFRVDEAGLSPARVFGVRRRSLTVVVEGGEADLHLAGRWFLLPAEARPTVGDWVLLDAGRRRIVRLLARRSLLLRRAAGRQHELQPLAANVDTMFLVTSCNEEFNRSRVERYLALALDAGIQPVVVLTKADLTDHPETYRDAVQRLLPALPVVAVNARDPATLAEVRQWCRTGQTVALFGSSGVGKSTLVNSLMGAPVQDTGSIRDADSKGRHTTTSRSLHLLRDGGLLLDGPGMRELTLADVDQGVAALFIDIEALAAECRFRNCRHDAEPGCAVRAALAAGALDARRLESYRKLGPAVAETPVPAAPRPRGTGARGRRGGPRRA